MVLAAFALSEAALLCLCFLINEVRAVFYHTWNLTGVSGYMKY